MSKVSRPPISITKHPDLKDLSFTELQARFDGMYTDCTDTVCKDTVQNLLLQLQVHQIELEMQNRELIEAQQQLVEVRDRYADLYDFAPVCYITFDARGCIQEINLTGADMLGQERGHLIGKPFNHWLSVTDMKRFFNHINYVQQGFEVAIEELKLKLVDGQCLDVRMESIAATQTIDNQPACRSVLINISARKEAERKYKQQARQLRLITDAMPAMIAYVDQAQRYLYVNKAYETWVDMPRNQIIGKSIKEVTGEEIYQGIEKMIHCALAGKAVNFEHTISYQDSSERDIKASYIPDFSDDGKVAGFFALIQDVTDIKRLEAEAKMRLLETAHVSRINTMGEMVVEIAHELNQPLAAISIYSDTAGRMLRKIDSEHQQDILTALDEIKLQTGRASQVIKRLRTFVSKKELQPTETDINALVKEALHLVGVEARWNNVVLNLELDRTDPVIFVDNILIEQVILNLLRNAIEAMGAIKQENRRLLIRTTVGKHNEVELDVEDSGPGLTSTEIEQAFEPFYSSKQNGMGMGLAICRSIIKAHHGRMWAIPNELGGTTFTFTISELNHAGEFQVGEME